MRPLSRVEFRVPLQVVQSAKARVARLTQIRLLVTVGEQVTLEIVVPRELRGAVRTFVLFRGGGW